MSASRNGHLHPTTLFPTEDLIRGYLRYWVNPHRVKSGRAKDWNGTRLSTITLISSPFAEKHVEKTIAEAKWSTTDSEEQVIGKSGYGLRVENSFTYRTVTTPATANASIVAINPICPTVRVIKMKSVTGRN